MQYIGEHLLPGQIGHFMAILTFVSALLAAVAFFMATKQRETVTFSSWRSLGRYAYLLHGLTTFGVIGVLFWILVGKMYEYQYAWANISDDLPVQYVFSAFWKEQQGSFLLWSFWHIILGVVLMFRAGKWETPVLTVIALTEVFISSMILGVYFGEFRFGASPFDLLRDTMDAPIFAQADYLSKIKGNGLNPLLQNYWMTIHPPTLFLGFASTIVPFAYAIAGLWLREHKSWLKPALNWSLFSGAILGLGILMGAAWAYEALSFAGYWAWDPVENTSLVPWLTMVAGIHTNLIARHTGYSIRSTYGFYLISFVLILYSTYLTRSGVLGDTSVHSFTEMGLGVQLIMFIGVFSILGLWMWASRYNEVPEIKGEEKANSREFWMFIGSLVLLFSAILMTGATSLPVVNKLFGTDYALKDPIVHHNKYQLWIAVFMGILTGVAQWMRYGERNWSVFARKFGIHMGVAVALAAILTYLNTLWIDVRAWQLFAFLFAGMFALVANLDYLVSMLKGNLKLAASAISHAGFGILLLGILSTGLGKDWISVNTFAMEGLIEGADDEALRRSVILMKEAPMPMRGFNAVYTSDTIERQTRTFTVQFERRGQDGNPTGERFTLYPNVMYDRQFSKVVANNPSTQHYWNYDVFTLVSSLPKGELDPEFAKRQDDSLKFEQYEARVGDTIFTKSHYLVVEGVTKSPKHPEYSPERGDLAVGLKMKAYALDQPKGYDANPMLYLRPAKGGFSLQSDIGPLQMKIRLTQASMDYIFKAEEALKYTNTGLREGEEFTFKGYKIRFAQVIKDIQHPSYVAEPGDIAVAAGLEITAPDGRQAKAAPVYLIRENQPFSLKDEAPELGLHFRFENIDPKNGVLTIGVAETPAGQPGIPVEIAENAARSDYIVLEAIIFPGINLVWVGSLMMLLGLAVGLWRRYFEA
ncbi:MAG TPA: cytochrome c biogenesis protein CcsA [Saprospiraceae bacterium]|nr:cytochrome c biogenesis protein CcsA [Saprospiraceae bacterium]